MALKIQNSRQLLKRTTVSGATPTVFTGSTDFTDGTWGVDDIYAGELYLNMADKKLWFGWETTGGTGVELIYPQSGSTTPPFTGGSGNCITDFYLTNMYGCSPINVWDKLWIQTGITINSPDDLVTMSFDSAGLGDFQTTWFDGNTTSRILANINGVQFDAYNVATSEGSDLDFTPVGLLLNYQQSSTQILTNGTTAGLGGVGIELRSDDNLVMYGHFNYTGFTSFIMQDGSIDISSPIVTMSNNLNVLSAVTASTYYGDISNTSDNTKQITVTFDGGGSPILSGSSTFIQVPYDATITGWNIFSDVSGSCVIDVWKSTYASYPPTVANTITGTEKPTLSSQNKNQDLNLTTWTTSVTAGDILYFNVDSASTVTRVVLTINLTKI